MFQAQVLEDLRMSLELPDYQVVAAASLKPIDFLLCLRELEG
jgi:hypothetical protein